MDMKRIFASIQVIGSQIIKNVEEVLIFHTINHIGQVIAIFVCTLKPSKFSVNLAKMLLYINSVLLLAILAQVLSDPTYVEELQDLLEDKVDVLELESLKQDDDMIRRDKMRKIHYLLMKKPRIIKAQYQKRLEIKKFLHDDWIQSKIIRASDEQIKRFWYEIQRLDVNWDISETEAAEREFQLLSNLTARQRRSLGNIWRC
ncbi:unnamed protein product [Cylicocyclus nassatus]|uniref:Uncharacterized protein n=1 Tax=Cylicocyclus nassatus TaxID=53992 RepID=A0AA36HFC5_CYLNA|nr:unnamed protein product [Cylicocyclus nassatus]